MSVNKVQKLIVKPPADTFDNFNYRTLINAVPRSQFFKVEQVTFGYCWPNIRANVNDTFTFRVWTGIALHSHTGSVLSYLSYALLNGLTPVNYNQQTFPRNSFLTTDQILEAMCLLIKQSVISDYQADGHPNAATIGGLSVLYAEITGNTSLGTLPGHNRVMIYTQSGSKFKQTTTSGEYIEFDSSPLLKMMGFFGLTSDSTSTLRSVGILDTSQNPTNEVAIFGSQVPVVIPSMLYVRSNELSSENELYTGDASCIAAIPLGALSHGKINTVACNVYGKYEPLGSRMVTIRCEDDFGPISELNPYNAMRIQLQVFMHSLPQTVLF